VLFALGFLAAFGGGTVFTALVGACWGGWGLWRLADGLRRYARADERGLRWRDGWRTRAATWEEIADFYLLLPDRAAGRTEAVRGAGWVTADGRAPRGRTCSP
jgi:hypothetical protein